MAGNTETIFATSTAGLPAAIAIVRVSGPHTRFAVETIAGGCPQARYAAYRRLKNPRDGGAIDRGLVLWFPGPESFTGEDLAEFHVHGGRAVVAALLEALAGLPGLRFAEAGEFTYRAFLNGKMDLTAVEGLADLLTAETEAQRRQALRQGEGRLGTIYEAWRQRIIRARAMIEAELDFADEEDVPASPSDGIWSDLAGLAVEIRSHIAGSAKARTIRSGLSVVLQGRPNAGKSSLLNALAKREAAIVSAEAGTTRDVVSVPMDLGGYLFTISDTAGIRDSASTVEAEGVRRALAAGEEADLVLWLREPGSDGDLARPPVGRETGPPVWAVTTKADLIDSAVKRNCGEGSILSATTGEGLAALEARLVEFAGAACGSGLEDLATRLRHVEALENTCTCLEAALAGAGVAIELRAEDLRGASDSLARLTGRIDVEDLLDVVFSEFCIGK